MMLLFLQTLLYDNTTTSDKNNNDDTIAMNNINNNNINNKRDATTVSNFYGPCHANSLVYEVDIVTVNTGLTDFNERTNRPKKPLTSNILVVHRRRETFKDRLLIQSKKYSRLLAELHARVPLFRTNQTKGIVSY